jgi:hypothetical protein
LVLELISERTTTVLITLSGGPLGGQKVEWDPDPAKDAVGTFKDEDGNAYLYRHVEDDLHPEDVAVYAGKV